jgi:hypothetical protein
MTNYVKAAAALESVPTIDVDVYAFSTSRYWNVRKNRVLHVCQCASGRGLYRVYLPVFSQFFFFFSIHFTLP